ncbi:MAG TPA: nucleoside/nucleotide kinase family protein [Streptomyces sp.]|uniref:nucleoside/nucleotide kinase family protein n=1 Tax=Streptomyces sp. TaxID=1931 RepID=UPI002D488AF4|nr:nucleoside/nucleotide kinase family protein [Streptomyces sp.]HZG06192.1 nucleoside/nucleotide kinase family protein [Streptomyces sp.]
MTITAGRRPAGADGPYGTPLYAQPPLEDLARRALGLARDGRAILGIVGEPGAGKSTLAEQLLARIETERPGVAVAVSMDGFHLAHKIIEARGQSAAKGTIDTFDGHGFLAMLRRTRTETHNSVWWPEFDRDLEDPVACSTEVAARHRLVIVDGNFLLSVQEPWVRVKDLLDEVWFLDAVPRARRERLTRRYISYGFDPEAARAKAGGVDERTSALIRSTAARADLVLREAR